MLVRVNQSYMDTSYPKKKHLNKVRTEQTFGSKAGPLMKSFGLLVRNPFIVLVQKGPVLSVCRPGL